MQIKNYFAPLLLSFLLSLMYSINANGQVFSFVKDITPGPDSSFEYNDDLWLPFGEVALFTLFNANSEHEVWRTDGTEAGTFILINLGFNEPHHALKLDDNTALFTATMPDDAGELVYKTDGSLANTENIYTHPEAFHHLDMVLFDGAVFVGDYGDTANGDSQLFRFDITSVTLTLITEFGFGSFRTICATDNYLYFMGGNSDGDTALFQSEGTAETTIDYIVINTGSEFSQNINMTAAGEKVFFWYRPNSDFDYSLWVTDGTEAGTQILMDFALNSSNYLGEKNSIIAHDGKVFFRATPAGISTTGWVGELYVSDGTPSGTFTIDMIPGDHDIPEYFTVHNNELYYQSRQNKKTYKTDGTSFGTTMTINLTDVTYGGSFGDEMLSNGEYLLSRGIWSYGSFGNNSGTELLYSDGTSEGTVLIDLVDGEEEAFPNALTLVGDKLIFTGESVETGRELMVLDLTTLGQVIDAVEPIKNQPLRMSIYPNPTKQNIRIQLPNTTSWDKLSVHNILGQPILELPITTSMATNEIMLPNLAQGSYVVYATNTAGEKAFAKVLVVE